MTADRGGVPGGAPPQVWFEYNFLFVLAANGSAEKSGLGDHSPVGYAQRARFYGGVSDAGRLLFAKGIASYIIFLADTTGQCSKDRCKGAYQVLDSYKSYADMLADIASGLEGPGAAAL